MTRHVQRAHAECVRTLCAPWCVPNKRTVGCFLAFAFGTIAIDPKPGCARRANRRVLAIAAAAGGIQRVCAFRVAFDSRDELAIAAEAAAGGTPVGALALFLAINHAVPADGRRAGGYNALAVAARAVGVPAVIALAERAIGEPRYWPSAHHDVVPSKARVAAPVSCITHAP